MTSRMIAGRRMAYSKVTAVLRELRAAHEEAEARKMPVDEVLEQRAGQRENRGASRDVRRRQFLKTAGLAGAGMLVRPWRVLASEPRIVVVGAGLAGLRFAHALWNDVRHPLPCSIYEASDRIGGRVWTNRSFFANGQIAEHGAEFISSEHASMRNLVSRLGLQLEVVNGGTEASGKQAFWIDGTSYSYSQLNADFQNALPALQAVLAAAPFPQTYKHHTAKGVAIDKMPVTQWIDQNIAGGTSGAFGKLLLTDLLAEYGGEPANQSALNLPYLLGFNSMLCPLAGTDEKYGVVGGNDQVATEMAAHIPASPINLGTSLIALKKNGQTYTCTFQSGASTFDVTADHVVLALPFTTLKNVDLSKAGFSVLKLTAIQNHVLGTNAKLALQFNSRPWQADNLDGVAYTDPANFQECWDSTVAQPGPDGILVQFPGGNAGGPGAFGNAAAHGAAPTGAVNTFLGQVEAVFPGCSAAYNGTAYLDWWAVDAYHFGAYTYYQPGQYTLFGGYEAIREGNVHFCGEHTNLDFQGFMEGAVVSAERLAFNWPRL